MSEAEDNERRVAHIDYSKLASATDMATLVENMAALLARLTETRASYLDELAAANLPTNIDSLLTRLTETRAEYLDDINDALRHKTYIFPGDTDLTLTLTAGQAADEFGTWASLIDSRSTNFSSLIATAPGHITVIQQEELSNENTRYMVELAYGVAKVHLTSQRFAGSGKFQNPDNHARIFGPEIPAGESVYYRMKSNTAVADTAIVHIRYHIH